MSGPTDLTILRALLASHKRLTAGEERSFKGMLTDLENGKMIRLSKKQRDWVEKRYNDLGLDRAFKDAPPPVIAVRKEVPKSFPWEQNRPLKPPGRS
jgi:hypothetical protein